MAFPNNSEPPKATSDARRTKNTRSAIAGVVILVLFGLLLISPSRNTHDKSAENPPHPATQAQP
jgi:hypothetical protein